MTRRGLLRLLGSAGLVLALDLPSQLLTRTLALARQKKPVRWSDRATWGGRVPRKRDVAVIGRNVILDINAKVAGVVIKPGGALIFHPRRSVSLVTRGSFVVRGLLAMRPKRPDVVHRIVFAGVREAAFKGGGMDVLRSDVGLWVVDRGRLVVAGSPKLAWTRTTGSVSAGASSIALRDDPVGWQVGDTVAITPTSPPGGNHHLGYDTATVAGIDGRNVALSQPTGFDHPKLELGGATMTAEVLNLTRNVVIEGTPEGRSHVFIRSNRPQSVRYAAVRHVGPRQNASQGTDSVLGRYGLHFHHCRGGSRGSVVHGLVVEQAGGHAFVPHMSDGITFRDCISHDTVDSAYWWDTEDESHDIVWERCVASLVKADPPFRGFRLAGFALSKGSSPVAVGCVAVGVQGNRDSSGFHWPEDAEGIWTFRDNVAHNNKESGIFVWQNTGKSHVISRFIGYHNGQAGINHGAYFNVYVYEDSVLIGNGLAGLILRALSAQTTPPLTFRRVIFDQAGRTPFAVQTGHHSKPGHAALFEACQFRGSTQAGFAALGEEHPDLYDLVNCAFEGNEFWIGEDVPPDTVIRVQDSSHGALQIRRSDQPGTPRPEWNASVT
jgi:hypothetical protein